MASTRLAGVKRKVLQNSDNSASSDSDLDSDDSLKDKDYVNSSYESETSEERDILNPNVSRGFIETPEKKPKSRWRHQHIETRKREKSKQQKNLGHSYENWKGKKILPKTMGPPCHCKAHCRSLLLGTEETIFHSFWNLASFDKQNAYLFGTIKALPKKRNYPKKRKRQISSRTVTFSYSVKINGVDVKICKEEFLSIHGLQNSRKRLYNICKQIRQGNTVPKCDQRGKHHNRKNRLPKESVKSVHDHIKAIPKYTSHYSRKKNPNRVYVDHDMSIASLYKNFYIPWCREQSIAPVKEDTYRRIFCGQYNIGFKLPKSDTCDTCDQYKTLLDSTKNEGAKLRQIQLNLELHQRRAEAMQASLKAETEEAKKGNQKLVISFDLQQALPMPDLTVGKAFYLRKAWMYNLGVHNCNTGRGFMFMWPEHIAKRGSDEIASAILKFINHFAPQADELIVFTDNCGGQNKNWTVMCLWLQLIRQKKFKVIEHRFLVPGHTHLPSDRDFAAIEKRKKYLKQVYSPEQWHTAVREAKIKNPFEVVPMTQSDFYAFGDISKFVNKKHVTDTKEPVN
nr:unnamed protein product [Callosobruchus chinensis]